MPSSKWLEAVIGQSKGVEDLKSVAKLGRLITGAFSRASGAYSVSS